jgi:hypothetical protein
MKIWYTISIRTIVLIIVLLSSSVSHAVPVFYDESVDGDLSDNALLPLFALDVGTNVIRGVSSISWPLPLSPLNYIADFDYFSFFVPDNTKLSSVSLSFSASGVIVAVAHHIASIDNLQDYPYNTIQVQPSFFDPGIPVDSSPVDLFQSTLPLGPGRYFIDEVITSEFAPDLSEYSGTYNYQFNIVVSSVPEPTSLLLLGSGLAGLVLARKKLRA